MKQLSLISALVFSSLAITAFAQAPKPPSDYERDRHRQMLRMIKEDVKKNYFDPKFKNIDVEANFKVALEKIDKATSIGQLSGIVAQFLVDFDDSHLFFLPPGKVNKTEYGFDFRMAGDKCFVIKVKKGTDAEKKGIQIGDELYAINNVGPNRENLWKLRYFFFYLRPQPALKLDVIKPDGKAAEYVVNAKITGGKQIKDLTGADLNEFIRESEDAERSATKQYFYDKLEGVFIWKMPSFSIDPSKVDDIMGRARKFPAMIFDLRGNSGGRVDMVTRLIGNVFDHNVKIADEKRRKETKEITAKTRGKDSYTGKIIVLIDSQSASASEVFSRVIQLEKRGVVYGDRSAGAVMESRHFPYELGMDVVIFFGASITVADLIMTDGKSLEKTGVVPDVLLLPSAKDLAEKRDVVLSKALESIGITITPEAAGALFPNADNDK